MSTITWDIPRATIIALKGTTEDVSDLLRMASAVKLYELGKLSSGAAAQLAGVPKTVFLAKLADYEVDTFQLSLKELKTQASLTEKK
ncbi:MAG: UPF0175 family protein [Chloroflexota bacterium]